MITTRKRSAHDAVVAPSLGLDLGVGLAAALCLVWMFGWYSLFTDVDHPLNVLCLGLPLTLENVARHGSRFLHFVFWSVDRLVCLTVCALSAGLLTELGLDARERMGKCRGDRQADAESKMIGG
jgi:hypothetical protein